MRAKMLTHSVLTSHLLDVDSYGYDDDEKSTVAKTRRRKNTCDNVKGVMQSKFIRADADWMLILAWAWLRSRLTLLDTHRPLVCPLKLSSLASPSLRP